MKNLRKKVVVAISVIAFVGASVFGVVNTVKAYPPDQPTATKFYTVIFGNCFVVGNTCIAEVIVTPRDN